MEENHLQADQALHYSDMLAVAERLPVTIVDGAAHRSVNSPSMEGVLLGLEVQQGLLATGYDVRFLKDFQIESTVEPSVICAVQLSGSVGPMKVDGVGSLDLSMAGLCCFALECSDGAAPYAGLGGGPPWAASRSIGRFSHAWRLWTVTGNCRFSTGCSIASSRR